MNLISFIYSCFIFEFMVRAIFGHRDVDHEDARRTITTVLNGDLGDFVGRQVKVLEMKQTGLLGGPNGHFHSDYAELWYVLRGRAIFEFDDLDETDTYKFDMIKGDRVLVPPRVAHRVLAYENCTLIGVTERIYDSSVVNDHPFNFGPWID